MDLSPWDKAQRYCDAVLDGKRNAGQAEKQAVERFHGDIWGNNLDGTEFVFAVERGERFVRFVEKLRHVVGPLASARKFFLLEDWQCWLAMNSMGFINGKGHRRFRQLYLSVGRGSGKDLAVDTPILTTDGWKTMGTVAVGDYVFHPDGHAVRVCAVSEVFTDHKCYRLKFDRGGEIVAGEGHLWRTDDLRDQQRRRTRSERVDASRPKRSDNPGRECTFEECFFDRADRRTGLCRSHQRQRDKGQPLRPLMTRREYSKVKTTAEIAASVTLKHPSHFVHSIPAAAMLDFGDNAAELGFPMPPYLLGCWLGDGVTTSGLITQGEQDADEMAGYWADDGVGLVSNRPHGSGAACRLMLPEGLRGALREIGLLGNKHIPDEYLCAHGVDRMRLLQGLIDTDGHIDKTGGAEICTIKETLAHEYAELIRSLGFKCAIASRRVTCRGKKTSTAHLVRFHPMGNDRVARLKRKREAVGNWKGVQRRGKTHVIYACDPCPTVPTRCIQVASPDGMFLAGEHLIPTHNSFLVGAFGLYFLVADGEASPAVYIASVDAGKSEIIFRYIKGMINSAPDLKRRFDLRITGGASRVGKILVSDTLGHLTHLSRENNASYDGLRGSLVVLDECWAFPKADAWESLVGGQQTRDQPMAIAITTAGFDTNSIAYEKDRDLRRVLSGEVVDHRFCGAIYTPDKDDIKDQGWMRPEVWDKAQPNLGVSVSRDFFEDQVNQASRSSKKRSTLLTKHLNVWLQGGESWLEPEALKACGRHPSDDPAMRWDALKGREVFIGLDLASVHDLTSICYLFPDASGVRVKHRNFCCRAQLADNEHWELWANDGWLEVAGDVVIDFMAVEERLEKDLEDFDVQAVGYDPHQGRLMMQMLSRKAPDLPVMQFPQMGQWPSFAIRTVETLVREGKLLHDANPSTTWMLQNVSVKENRMGYSVPDRTNADLKIDAADALFNSLSVRQHVELQKARREDDKPGFGVQVIDWSKVG